MQDELIKSYMTVLTEGKDSSAVEGSTLKAGKDAFGELKHGNEADENVDLESPEEDKDLSSDVKEGEPKKLDKASFQNPFDDLYNKIVSENSFSFSTEEDNEIAPEGDEAVDFDTQGDLDDDLADDMEVSDDEDGLGDDIEGDEESEEVDLASLVGTLKDVLSQLEKIIDNESDEDEVEDIEDMDDSEEESEEDGDEDSEESEEEGEESEDEEKGLALEEGWKEKQWDKKHKGKKNSLKSKKSSYKKQTGHEEELAESLKVKVKGLKKGVNLTPFKGNAKKLQNKKAEVADNSAKPTKSKAQVPSTGKGYNGVPTKLSPTAGHNLTKASSHTVSGAVKAGKALFDQ